MGTKEFPKEKITFRLVLGGGVVMLFLVWGLIFRNIYINNPEYIKKNIEKILPAGAFLRDYKKLNGAGDNAYLVIYVEKDFTVDKTEGEALLSCPGEIVGQPIKGKYHLELIENYKTINDVSIPYYMDRDLALVYRNIKANIYGNFNRKDGMEMEGVPLLVLKDYTGDEKPFEFLIITSEGGCGFWNGLVAGYDPDTNKAVLFSDWIHNLNPNNKGYFQYLFDCGNHGNQTRVEEDYQYSPTVKWFIKTGERQTPCSA